jgi:hypothetical protein
MKLDVARTLIAEVFGRMDALYHATVFDEWVVVSLHSARSRILAYSGPRSESYQQRFSVDVGPLRSEMTGKQMAIGGFEFAPGATGTRYDGCLRLGAASYLICNHTTQSMAQIRQNPNWIEAQKPFVELSERFRADPLA